MDRLERLLHPKSIAVIGGGAWCANVLEQCQKMGFTGPVWPVHPSKTEMNGLQCFRSIDDLPEAPDACFIGVNRFATIDVLRQLNAIGAQGAVCFASGFLESKSEDAQAADLQDQLLEAAGDMAVLGPNCYGFVNYLDGALLWPDQHGGERVDSGVAIITQSSNIVINLTMQKRGLPIAFVSTAGNQAQIDLADMGATILRDPRVTALGLHVEGIDNLASFEKLAATAITLGKQIIAVKVGASEQAQEATISHTASLAGSDAGARALFKRLGIAQVENLSDFLEALKVAHVAGALPNTDVISISCSGGEASLMADLGQAAGINFPPLTKSQKTELNTVLGPMVKLANPLDYHTYIWGDNDAMARMFTAAMNGANSLTMLVLDFPRPDRCDMTMWVDTIASLATAKQATGGALGVVASIADTMPEQVAQGLIAQGIIPFFGMESALNAVAAMGSIHAQDRPALLTPIVPDNPQVLSEAEAKDMLAKQGLRIPKSGRAFNTDEAGIHAETIGYPVVLKGEGIAHKTESGAVVLNLLNSNSVTDKAKTMPCDTYLVEEMIIGGITELLVGVVLDPAHGYVLTLAAGGQLTEILNDKTSMLIPTDETSILNALKSLKSWPLLNGYRGTDSVDLDAVISAIIAVQDFVIAQHGRISEIEINPLSAPKTMQLPQMP